MVKFTKFSLTQSNGNAHVGYDVEEHKLSSTPQRLGTIYLDDDVFFIATPALKLSRMQMWYIWDFMSKVNPGLER